MANWNAELVVEETKIFSPKNVDGTCKLKKNGDPLKVFHTKRTIELTRGRQTLCFAVSRAANGCPLITDTREAATGACPETNRGPLPGADYCKPGKVKKLSPSEWGREVERLIGPEAVGRIFVALINEGFAA